MNFQKKNKDLAGSFFITSTKVLFGFLVFILFLILAKITYEGIGVVSLEFIFDEPRNNMTEGGIWPAIFG
ncbi:MAG: phosphate ABC transporter, permease protein PstA, partial [Ignavibacteriae bacterium]|nr:phosphate ABC transporter, permease protein PstA [Ignavibacteriota bacterium]